MDFVTEENTNSIESYINELNKIIGGKQVLTILHEDILIKL